MNKFLRYALIILSAFLVSAIILSIPWRFRHDSPIMLYIAFLMDHFGYVPYHNIFDMNMPGTYLAYFLIGKLFGYTDIGVRSADLLVLVALVSMNWFWMRKISPKVAWIGSVLWGLLYLGLGPSMSMQREYLILLPVLSGCLLFSRLWEKPFLRNLAMSFCFGIASTMKPHAAIGVLAFIFLDFINIWQKENHLRGKVSRFLKNTALPVAIGFSLPLAIVMLYLVEKGVAQDFLSMAENYWPLYSHLSGDVGKLSGFYRIIYILQNWRLLGDFAVWLAPASIGSYIALQQPELKTRQREQIIILMGLAICYGVYPIFSGQFWSYHWMLFLFFILQVASLCLIEQPERAGTGYQFYPMVVLFLVIFLTLPLNIFIPGEYVPPPKDGRVDEIVAFLQPKLRAGDTVQPLDWTGGAIHAMLILRAKIATPYQYLRQL